ncbi:hypothetical protein [Anianabacter salinae]|uniref:hypothetical protein n=1 Tax=Anianabacter salinae TaxID=2851023 RepID=UPI00225E2350|nr:hypothetical protein [Anianabacter salinae]MBV0911966.1 hypothetical protein [Anianabacter salinae]
MFGVLPAGAQEGPLSIIDWLSNSMAEPAVAAPRPQPPTSDGASPPGITVSTIENAAPVAVGLLPVSVTGLPRDLWGKGKPADIAAAFAALPQGLTPGLRDLAFTLLLAEVDPPLGGDPADTLFLARLDTLLRYGAVDDVKALVDRAGRTTPPIFRRYFDAALLTGTETEACERLAASPDLAPSFPARVFCLARAGDWDTAALTLGTGEAIGVIDPAEGDLLHRFLDPEAAENGASLAPPRQPTPLELRLFEAIGETLPTGNMPLAFARADLSDQTGWRQKIEAAERLVRSGALEPNLLLGLYTERSPAASGGLWDRVAAVQAFDAALASGGADAVAAALPSVWSEMQGAGLAVALADLYADRLATVDLEGDAARLAVHLRLLGPAYESAAQATAAEAGPLAVAIATGRADGVEGSDAQARALLDGFRARGIPERYGREIETSGLGAAILSAIGHFERGAAGDLRDLTDAVAFFRAIGLHDTARRAALQTLILDQRG